MADATGNSIDEYYAAQSEIIEKERALREIHDRALDFAAKHTGNNATIDNNQIEIMRQDLIFIQKDNHSVGGHPDGYWEKQSPEGIIKSYKTFAGYVHDNEIKRQDFTQHQEDFRNNHPEEYEKAIQAQYEHSR